MSAYVCCPEHFQALAIFATKQRHGSLRVSPLMMSYRHPKLGYLAKLDCRSVEEIATEYAEILYRENVRSVNHRYSENEPANMDVSVTFTMTRDSRYNLDPVNILSMIHGLEYQSCESDDYWNTEGYVLLSAIKDAAIRALPGYDDGIWTFSLNRHAA